MESSEVLVPTCDQIPGSVELHSAWRDLFRFSAAAMSELWLFDGRRPSFGPKVARRQAFVEFQQEVRQTPPQMPQIQMPQRPRRRSVVARRVREPRRQFWVKIHHTNRVRPFRPIHRPTQLYVRSGLNSHYFHIIGDGTHQPNNRVLYTNYYKDSVIKGGRTIHPPKNATTKRPWHIWGLFWTEGSERNVRTRA